LAGLIIYPALYSIYPSMLNKVQTRFIGLDNFSYLSGGTHSGWFVEQSAIFALSAVFFKALIGLVTAHLVNNLPSKGQRKVARHAARAMGHSARALDPGMVVVVRPTTAHSTGYPGVGGNDIPWLSNPYWRASRHSVNVWYGAPFFLIMYLAALNPSEQLTKRRR